MQSWLDLNHSNGLFILFVLIVLLSANLIEQHDRFVLAKSGIYTLDAYNKKICGRTLVEITESEFSRKIRPPETRRSFERSLSPSSYYNYYNSDIIHYKRRISAGYYALPGEFPWFAQVIHPVSSCGGIIIDSYYVLTAAHCCIQETEQSERSKPRYIKIYAGLTEIKQRKKAQKVLAESVCFSKSYNTSEIDDNRESSNLDVALIKLAEPLEYNNYVQPACLPPFEGGPIQDRYDCITAGFGDINKFRSADFLRALPVTKCERREDANYYSDESCYKTANPNWYPGDTCVGDSGGGLYCLKKEGGKKRYAVGLVSSGEEACSYDKITFTDYSDFELQHKNMKRLYDGSKDTLCWKF